MTLTPANRAIRIFFAAALFLMAMTTATPHAQVAQPALPQVSQRFAGDPRLEPLPANPVHLANVEVFTTDQFGVEKRLMMRFPPRVNGQNESDGDKHADLYVLFDATTHKQINQPVILEAVPKNAASGLTVSDRKVGPGGSVTLSWSTTGADLVTLSPGIGPVSSSGSIVVKPLVTTIYTLTATNPAGSVTSSVRVNVTLPLSAALQGGLMPPP